MIHYQSSFLSAGKHTNEWIDQYEWDAGLTVNHFDALPFIWDNFTDVNYITGYMEDLYLSTFNYLKKGFLKQVVLGFWNHWKVSVSFLRSWTCTWIFWIWKCPWRETQCSLWVTSPAKFFITYFWALPTHFWVYWFLTPLNNNNWELSAQTQWGNKSCLYIPNDGSIQDFNLWILRLWHSMFCTKNS